MLPQNIQPHLTDYYYRIRRRGWVVVSALFLTVLITALHVFTTKPVYEATAGLIVDAETTRSPLTGEQLQTGDLMSEDLTFRTHLKLITSKPVLEKVLAELGPQPKGPRKFKTTFLSNLEAIFGKSKAVPGPEGQLLQRVNGLAGKIKVDRVMGTRLLSIHVQDTNPKMAETIANSVANNYILYDTGTRLDSSRRVLDWLSKELYEMKKKVETAQMAFLAYKTKENLISIKGNQSFNLSKIQGMNTDLIKTKSDRMAADANIVELKKFIGRGNLNAVPTFLNDPILSALNSQLVEAEVDYQKLSGIYKQKHPEIVKITSKIGELKTEIRDQLQKALTNAEAARSVLIAREGSLQQAIAGIEKDAQNTNKKAVGYSILERDVDTNTQLYNTLLAKIKQSNITDQIMKSNLRLALPATLPLVAVRPKKASAMTMAVFLGLAIGIGLAFFLEYMDQTVYSNEAVTEALQIPVLAEIPLEGPDPAKKEEPGKGRPPVPTVLEAPFAGHFSESFRQLATNLRFSELNRTRGVYLITSCNPKEGKTTLTYNLGLTMAQIGMKTLVIDADLRIPSIGKVVKLSKDRPGLTEILANSFSTKITEGELGDLTVGDIHKLIEMQERTGALYYQNEKNSFAVSFVKGRLVDVDWSTRPEDKKLGGLLVRSGKITGDQLEIALASRQASTERLGQVLLHLGFIGVDELAGPLRLHIQENIDELNRCGHAQYRFEERLPSSSPFQDSKEAALIEAIGIIDNDTFHLTPFLMAQIEQCLHHVPEQNMWVLTSGKTPPNPPELLASNRMRVLVELLRRRFDTIIIDSPPVATVNDAAVLASLCDGLIMLVKAGSTDLVELERAKQKLDSVQAPVIGLVLNMLDFKKDPYYYGRYYYKRYDSYYKKSDVDGQ
ncbi:MAG: polysaccharide biosynthesis tyrosine autokinase [Syntrophobacteraceae bacterium]|nr:polysaccharide biosynthesis tyrosine autokinase [Syntrophobacteraceae bacterium]